MLHQYLKMALVIVMVAPTVVQVDESDGREQHCLVTVVAPVGSCQQMGGGPRRVSLSRLLGLARQHNLKLREGRPPPHTVQPHFLVTTCHPRRRMWAMLPHQGSSTHALEDDNSRTFPCIVERVQETFLALFGVLPWSPEQKDGAPQREFMINYCGRDLPLKRKPVGGKRMYKETLRLEKELLALP